MLEQYLPAVPDGEVGERRSWGLSRQIPDKVALGFHFCFGTFGGWPRFAPEHLGRTVELANAAVDSAGRRIDWVHIPALNRGDDAFYAPLARLDARGAQVYLGLITAWKASRSDCGPRESFFRISVLQPTAGSGEPRQNNYRRF
jgi:hypothetical protein